MSATMQQFLLDLSPGSMRITVICDDAVVHRDRHALGIVLKRKRSTRRSRGTSRRSSTSSLPTFPTHPSTLAPLNEHSDHRPKEPSLPPACPTEHRNRRWAASPVLGEKSASIGRNDVNLSPVARQDSFRRLLLSPDSDHGGKQTHAESTPRSLTIQMMDEVLAGLTMEPMSSERSQKHALTA